MTVKTFDQIQAGASLWRQYFFCSSLFLVSITVGYVTGLISVLMAEISNGADGFQLSSSQLSWAASSALLVACPVMVLGGFLAKSFGRKTGALLVCPVFILGYIFIYLSTPALISLLYIGICLHGLGIGLQHASISSYLTEVSSPQNRTAMHSFAGVWVCLGQVLPIIEAACGLHWYNICLIGIIFPTIGLLIIPFIPESPSWFVVKGKPAQARTSLVKLRGPNYPVDDELIYLQKSYAFTQQNTTSFREVLSRLKSPDVWKPLIIVNITFLLQGGAGFSALDRYVVLIFQASGSTFSKYTASIPVQGVKIFSQLFGSVLLVRYPRKPIFTTSCILVGLGLAGLGASIILNPAKSELFQADTNSLNTTLTTIPEVIDEWSLINFLPIFCFCTAAFAVCFGFSPIPWAYSNELFPLDVRSQLSGLTASFVQIIAFAQVKTFPALSEWVGIGEAIIFCAAVSFLAAVWGIVVLPETKGKTLHQINRMFFTEDQLKMKIKEVDVRMNVIKINGTA